MECECLFAIQDTCGPPQSLRVEGYGCALQSRLSCQCKIAACSGFPTKLWHRSWPLLEYERSAAFPVERRGTPNLLSPNVAQPVRCYARTRTRFPLKEQRAWCQQQKVNPSRRLVVKKLSHMVRAPRGFLSHTLSGASRRGLCARGGLVKHVSAAFWRMECVVAGLHACLLVVVPLIESFVSSWLECRGQLKS